ncbi:hypothetical protein X878_0084 [Enterococcus phage VD13]|uniref:Uncharacterized protein n=1 Tax=Enterococcus phage VD13 TaxID=1458851 RepID=X2KXU0_9CAUD|nr:hypothetical protein X878_0084 [Enterococcus phage VD13]YP_009592526.1 hypothetical protein FDG77_gp85 [Enterococcus phage VD13]AHL19670.1 hypothetical protein VD13_085 [Enterococcus phage VD13]AHN83172.1 hypothetical protein X878_0084 [Enterococcus phage VD13]
MTKENNVFLDEKGFFNEIIEVLENGFSEYYCDLHSEVFSYGVNADIKDLEEYGIFDAIGEIQEYESNYFGEISIDLSSPDNVADMLYFIKGYEFLNETLNFNTILEEVSEDFFGNTDLWNEAAEEEYNKAIAKRLMEEFKNVYC